MDPFEVQDIGIGPGESRGLEGAVEVDELVVFGGRFGCSAVEVDDFLVVPVHEVDLPPSDSHLGIMAADGVHILFEGGVSGPEDETDPLGSGIAGKLREIDFRNDLHQVGLFVDGPSLVEDHVFHTAFGGEIDVILIGFGIDAGLEVYAGEVPGVPPVPGDLAGADPGIVPFGRTGEAVDHVVLGELPVISCENEDSPGKGFRDRSAVDVIFPGLDEPLEVVVATLTLLLRIPGENAVDIPAAFSPFEVHAGIVQQVGFRNADFSASRSRQRDGQEGDPILFPGGYFLDSIGVFEGVEELILIAFLFPYVRDPGRRVFREAELRGFVADRYGRESLETVGCSVVIGAEDHLELLVGKTEFVAGVLHRGALVKGRGEGLADRYGLRLELSLAAIDASVGEAEGEPGGGEDGHPFPGNGPGQIGASRRDGHDGFPVRRGKGIVFGGCGKGREQQDGKENGSFHSEWIINTQI